MAGSAEGAQAAAPPGGDGPASLEERGQDHEKIRAREAMETLSSERPASLEGRGPTHDSGRHNAGHDGAGTAAAPVGTRRRCIGGASAGAGALEAQAQVLPVSRRGCSARGWAPPVWRTG